MKWTSPCCRVTLHRGHCLELLADIGFFHHVITDPPYGIKLRNADASGVFRRKRSHTIHGDDSTQVGEQFLSECRRLIGVTGSIIAFASPSQPWSGRWRNLIVWDKGGAVGGGGDIATCLKRTWELIQAWNAKPLNGPRDGSVWSYPIVPADTTDHICAKPVPLMERLTEVFTDSDDVVLDGFMGSGSTGVAAVRTGRRFIGIELDPTHFETSKRRIMESLALPVPDKIGLSQQRMFS